MDDAAPGASVDSSASTEGGLPWVGSLWPVTTAVGLRAATLSRAAIHSGPHFGGRPAVGSVGLPGLDHLQREPFELEMAGVEGFGQRDRVSDLTGKRSSTTGRPE
jgi:hypothetical protein